MPIINKEKKKEYSRNWMRKKRAGLPTRTTPLSILSKEERKKIKIDNNNKWNKKRTKERKEIITQFYGNKCPICGQNYRMQLHRKDGKKHVVYSIMNKKDFDEIFTGDKYIFICYDCHKHIHWCMDYMNMKWENINKNLIMGV
jgi:hypothetical protein